MTDTAIKTYLVGVIERALAYYEVEAEDARTAAENWQDGEFDDRDEEALDTEGPCNVREQQPDGSWRKVPKAEWQATPPGSGVPDDWQLMRHVPASDYGPDAYTLWPYGAIVKGLPEAAAQAINVLPGLLRSLTQCAEMLQEFCASGGATTRTTALSKSVLATLAHAAVTRPHVPASDPAKKPYSVLLLYPHYTNDGGHETFYAFVEAPDPIEAITLAQRQALQVNEWVENDLDDFTPLLVTEGHQYGQPLFRK